MATLALTALGGAVGGSIGGSFLGISSVVIGKAVGSIVGNYIDRALFAPNSKQNVDGPRNENIEVTSSAEGAPIPRGYGKFTVGGNIIWATRPEEIVTTETTRTSTKGGGSVTTTRTIYTYYANLAVAICEGEISNVERVWIDGKLADKRKLTIRLYKGTETQNPDSLMEAKEGTGNVPAYRGLAYMVFEDLLLEPYGNRIPQFEFEVVKPVSGATGNIPMREGLLAAAIGPGTVEYGYGTTKVEYESYSSSGEVVSARAANRHLTNGPMDWNNTLNRLSQGTPNLNRLVLSAAWYSDNLDMYRANIMPRVAVGDEEGSRPWTVAGLKRGKLVSTTRISKSAVNPDGFGETEAQGLARGGDVPVTGPDNMIEIKWAPGQSTGSWRKFAGDVNRQELYVWVDSSIPGLFFPGTTHKGANFDTEHAVAAFGSKFLQGASTKYTINGVEGSTFNNLGGIVVDVNLYDGTARPVSEYNGQPSSQGTPDEQALIEGIAEADSRGYQVQLYPELLVDIPEGNFEANPYADGYTGAEGGEITPEYTAAAYPHKSYITAAPAIGYANQIDGTSRLQSRVDAFFGTVTAADYSNDGTSISYSGDVNEWSYRRFIFYYVELAKMSGKVDEFVVGGGLKGITRLRDDNGSFLVIEELLTILEEVKTELPGVRVSYSADWEEYGAYEPADGSGDILFPLDRLWGSDSADFIGIEPFIPLSDWRDDEDHLDEQAGWLTIYDTDYLKSNIEGGEHYDWKYASDADRVSQTRTTIADVTHGEPWVFRKKDFKNWWQNPHRRRPAGALNLEIANAEKLGSEWTATGTGPATLTDLSPTYYLGRFDDAVRVASGGNNDDSGVAPSTAANEHSPGAGEEFYYTIWLNEGTSGQLRWWLAATNQVRVNGTLGSLAVGLSNGNTVTIDEEKDLGNGYWRVRMRVTWTLADTVKMRAGPNSTTVGEYIDVLGFEVSPDGYLSSDWEPESKPILFPRFGCPAIDKGSNQPGTIYDPKSGTSSEPYFSKGGRDDEIQNRYVTAMVEYWRDNANNPNGSKHEDYSARMIEKSGMYCWQFDVRPWPTFPVDPGLWGENELAQWTWGNWLSGRIESLYLPDLLAEIAEDYGIDFGQFDEAYGFCDGYVIGNVMSFRTAIDPLLTGFQFDLVESGSVVKAVSRFKDASVATITLDDLMDSPDNSEPITLTQLLETEMPKAVEMRVMDSLNEYEVAAVRASHPGVQSRTESLGDLPIVTDMPRAQQLVDRSLYYAWAQRDIARFGLPPSFLYLEPTDVVTLSVGNFDQKVRVDRIADTSFRGIEGRTFNKLALVSSKGELRTPVAQPDFVSSPPVVFFMDLPILSTDAVEHQPYAIAYASPFTGVDIYSSPEDSSYDLNVEADTVGIIGETTAVFNSGPEYIWDNANTLEVEIYRGSFASTSELQVFGGANTLAVQNSSGGWEILSFVNATLIGTRKYQLTRLLRGLRGTEDQMENNLPAGAKIAFLDTTPIVQVDISVGDIGTSSFYRYGPADIDVGDESYVTTELTFEGRGLMPFAPARFEGKLSSGDVILSWIRRDRSLEGDAWVTGEIPLSEETEQYEVDILNSGGSVVRTLSVTDAQTVTYTSAQQSTDGISVPFDAIVYQISAVIGRGIGRRETING